MNKPTVKSQAFCQQTLLISAKETARALSISSRKLWELTNCGNIPHVKIGTRTLYDPNDLRAWIDRRKKGGNHETG